MSTVKPKGANENVLRLYALEVEAEEHFASGEYATASEKLQALLDSHVVPLDDKGWYLQEMARYHHRSNRTESDRLQVAAHKNNRLLLKPASGVTVAKLVIQSQGRVGRIAKWSAVLGSIRTSMSACLIFWGG
jgi:hypothetical protein